MRRKLRQKGRWFRLNSINDQCTLTARGNSKVEDVLALTLSNKLTMSVNPRGAYVPMEGSQNFFLKVFSLTGPEFSQAVLGDMSGGARNGHDGVSNEIDVTR